MPAASSTAAQFTLEDTAAVLIPSARSLRTSATEVSYASTPRAFRCSRKYWSFRLPSARTVCMPGASSGAPWGSAIPREARNAATPS